MFYQNRIENNCSLKLLAGSAGEIATKKINYWSSLIVYS